MAKTQFLAPGTIVTSAFMQAIFGQGADGGHKHDGVDADGHAAKISAGEIEKEALETLVDEATTRAITSAFPLGSIQMYAGNIPPLGYLLCDGAAVPSDSIYDGFRQWIDQNAAYLKSNNGYRTPDLRGRVAVGEGMKTENDKTYEFNLGSVGGEFEHKLLAAESGVGRHRHSVVEKDDVSNKNNKAEFKAGDDDGNTVWTSYAEQDADQPHNNIQPYAVVNYIIRAVN